jgi:peroxiredoxin
MRTSSTRATGGIGLCLAILLCGPQTLTAQEADNPAVDEVLAGHSYHGEAFNEGPRQRPYRMSGLGRSQFRISSPVPEARQFFNQGVDQLHGFWYFEAERSFREVADLDPQCAMACWGLAMANINNEDRAREFVQQALEKSDQEDGQASDREKMYIRALAKLYDENVEDSKKRARNYTAAMESLVLEYPDDIEAKAFLACQIWMNQRAGIPITSHVAVNALLDQVFAADPMHPAHHYRIHLWDYEKPEIALQSSALCGPSLPDIAHMWHMPGHIYSRLKRYEDAVWQQEASARVDHRHMMHDQVLPDQIHNFAHNNEWCVRNLNHVGRVRDAIALATNMISLPRHPVYNKLDDRGSAWYGRQRLFETLSRYELWQELIDLCQSAVLEPTDDAGQQIKRLRYLGRAYYRLGQPESGRQILEQLQERQHEVGNQRDADLAEAVGKEQKTTRDYREMVDPLLVYLPIGLHADVERNLKKALRRDHRKRVAAARRKAGKQAENDLNVIRRAIDELQGYQLWSEGQPEAAVKLLQKAGEVDALFRASLWHAAGHTERALKQARQFVEGHENEVQPLACLTWLLWQTDHREEAFETFEKLRRISGSIDRQSPVFQRLDEVAAAGGIEGDWRIASQPAGDLGDRPDLASLGPFRWQPSMAADWELPDPDERRVSLKQFQGQPVVLIFYLGHGCLHCAEQLQAFAPMVDRFQQAGIEVIAISTDGRDGLRKSLDSYGDRPLPIRLLADPDYHVFRQYRAFDEFESQPLHGTFLIDGEGRIRWQDISYEPFMKPEFLLKEAVRLLSAKMD